jgi:predicted NUDIX family NTP pyrophosphohydrolase
MLKKSAGVLVFRVLNQPEVLLVHPGGPFFRNKDAGAWSIPKGEYATELPLDVAVREFEEETGNKIKNISFIALGDVRLKSGKTITAWAVEDNFDEAYLRSNEFEMEWPPNSGRFQRFPEVDKAEWFSLDVARKKLNPAQVQFIDRLVEYLNKEDDTCEHS